VAPDGVDGLADGAVQNELAVGAVRDGGAFAAVRGWAGTGERGITFHRTMVRTYDRRADLLDRLRDQVEAGLVTLRVAATYSMEQAAEAHRRLEAGGTRGRCVILFDHRLVQAAGTSPAISDPLPRRPRRPGRADGLALNAARCVASRVTLNASRRA
jgi:hypothetical protein